MLIKKNQMIDLSFNKEDIACYIHCEDCVSTSNPKGELLVLTKTAGLKLTDKNIESEFKFIPIMKQNKAPPIEIQFEIKPLFGNDELPIANAYIQYLLK